MSSLERAFELAKSGCVKNVASLVVQINKEGYDGEQLNGSQLRKQLCTLMKDIRKCS